LLTGLKMVSFNKILFSLILAGSLFFVENVSGLDKKLEEKLTDNSVQQSLKIQQLLQKRISIKNPVLSKNIEMAVKEIKKQDYNEIKLHLVENSSKFVVYFRDIHGGYDDVIAELSKNLMNAGIKLVCSESYYGKYKTNEMRYLNDADVFNHIKNVAKNKGLTLYGVDDLNLRGMKFSFYKIDITAYNIKTILHDHKGASQLKKKIIEGEDNILERIAKHEKEHITRGYLRKNINELQEKYMNIERSYAGAFLTKKVMEREKLNSALIIYGTAHAPSLIKRFDELGISVIEVLKDRPFDQKSDFDHREFKGFLDYDEIMQKYRK